MVHTVILLYRVDTLTIYINNLKVYVMRIDIWGIDNLIIDNTDAN